jgi:hypothetical protein
VLLRILEKSLLLRLVVKDCKRKRLPSVRVFFIAEQGGHFRRTRGAFSQNEGGRVKLFSPSPSYYLARAFLREPVSLFAASRLSAQVYLATG